MVLKCVQKIWILMILVLSLSLFYCNQNNSAKPQSKERDMDLQTLVNQVKEKRPESQGTASRLGQKATAALVPLADDPDPEVRHMALICLGITGGSQASGVALKKLKDEDGQVVAQALQVLYKHPPVNLEKELLEAYEAAKEASVREDLPLIAGRLAPNIDPGPWKALWENETNEEIKNNLLIALSRMGDKQARQDFVQKMVSSKGLETVKWIDHCKYMEDPWIVPHMLPLLNRQEIVTFLTPDLKNKRPMRIVDFIVPAIVELTGAKVGFPIKRTDPFTSEEIEQVRRIAIQVGK
jgi:hypothetical protein